MIFKMFKAFILVVTLVISVTYAGSEKNSMNEEVKVHLGFSAQGENLFDHGLPSETNKDTISEKELANKDCTVLWWNGEYQKPNITVTKGEISVSLGRNVKKIQLRHVPSGAIRYYKSGVFKIPNGVYVLSLFGSTYPHEYIKACVSYE